METFGLCIVSLCKEVKCASVNIRKSCTKMAWMYFKHFHYYSLITVIYIVFQLSFDIEKGAHAIVSLSVCLSTSVPRLLLVDLCLIQTNVVKVSAHVGVFINVYTTGWRSFEVIAGRNIKSFKTLFLLGIDLIWSKSGEGTQQTCISSMISNYLGSINSVCES